MGSVKKPTVEDLLKKVDLNDTEPTDPTLNGIRYAMKNIKRVACEILKLAEDDNEREGYVKTLKSQMLKLTRAEINYLAGPKIVDQVFESLVPNHGDPAAVEGLENGDIIRVCDDISTVSQEKLRAFDEALKEKDLKKHPFYVDLLEEIEQITANLGNDEDDSDDTDMDTSVMDIENPGNNRGRKAEEMIPVFDPITKQPLTDPVRNKFCNHIYGRSSILDLLKKNPKLRCPTIGCSNKKFVLKEHLVHDKTLIGKIRKKQKELKKQKDLEELERERTISTGDETFQNESEEENEEEDENENEEDDEEEDEEEEEEEADEEEEEEEEEPPPPPPPPRPSSRSPERRSRRSNR